MNCQVDREVMIQSVPLCRMPIGLLSVGEERGGSEVKKYILKSYAMEVARWDAVAKIQTGLGR